MSWEQRAGSNEQRAGSNELGAKGREQRGFEKVINIFETKKLVSRR
jgi:hypothetical protein